MATFKLGREFKGLQPKLEKLFKMNNINGDGYTVSIGRSTDPEFATPANAVYNPTVVCDSALLGDQLFASDADKDEYDEHPELFGFKPTFNFRTNKFDTRFTRLNSVNDSLIDLQAVAPWNASYFPQLFTQPLISTHGLDMVERYTGDNPFADVMNLVLANYAGNAIAEQAGTMQSNLSHNVAVASGMMSQAVINVKVFYNYTLEEEQRYARGNNPYGSQLRDLKKIYAEKMLKLTLDVLTYFGNTSTETTGLFNVNVAEEWTDDSMTTISTGTSTTKGSKAYQLLSKAIIKFAEENANMADTIKVGMSLTAYNLLSSMPYSDAYSGQSALAVLKENFGAGRNEFGEKLNIDFYCDPLLNAQTDYNLTAKDNLIITAPRIGGQSTVMAGIPLERFMYPVYPTQYETQYCVMSRWAGIFAPMASAVKVYKGFGI